MVQHPREIDHQKFQNVFCNKKLVQCHGRHLRNCAGFYLLPFIIGTNIPKTMQGWLLYIMLRKIVDIMLAPVLDSNWIPYLEMQIAEFMTLFLELFPGKFSPKLHYVVHYPQLLKNFGPLQHLWCMRFEEKHQYFKRLLSVVCNFQNIAYTLAHHHQMRQCFE